jgi:hypothetical protein
LIGERGILPVADLLEGVRAEIPLAERLWLLPTLFWIDASDRALLATCVAGALLSVALVLGIAPRAVLVILWSAYLSLAGAGQIFLGYQWDTLLLETGLLAMLLAPGGARPRAWAPPSSGVWPLRLLVFRLTVASGAVKLLSGDPSWRGLAALRFHYETQPLPTWIGYYVHALPAGVHTASTIAMFLVELLAPVLLFCTPRLRRAGCAALVGLQALIALTGNYAFFNLLTVALCLLALEDDDLPRWIRARAPRNGDRAAPPRPSWSRGLAAVVLGVLGLATFLDGLGLRLPWPPPTRALMRLVAPFESVNRYGLFAVMTTRRPEIVVEGSRDGRTWSAYGFRWKPGDLEARPRFVAPHQPRLDWQLWFAALGRCRDNPWFVRFLLRLRDGAPEVRRLLAVDPFGDAPPAYLRAVLYEYRFTRPGDDGWWRREPLGLYCPVIGP